MRLTICLMLLLACGVMSAQTRRALLVGISDYPKAVAIAHLKNNDKKGAKAVLENLISTSEEGSVVSEKAKELLEKL